MRSLARRLIGVWLIVDGVTTGMWFSTLADSLGGRDLLSVSTMVARVIVAALSVVAGWLITQRRPQGAPLGIVALSLIALLGLFSARTRVLPSNLDPSFHWPVAFLTALCAAGAVWFLRNDSRKSVA